MKVSIKIDEILEEILIEELEWLIEEFEILFKSKDDKYTERDHNTANAILDYFLENTYVGDNLNLINFLNKSIENIENMYTNLF